MTFAENHKNFHAMGKSGGRQVKRVYGIVLRNLHLAVLTQVES